MDRATSGREGEERAARYLREAGYEVLERNFRTRRGEIDIVARNAERVVFVEVKSWNSVGVEHLGQAIDHRKRERIRGASRTYLMRHPELQERRVGYDVIFFPGDGRRPLHYENAFNGV